MSIENGVSVLMRFSPEVAEVIGRQFLSMAEGARKIKRDKEAWHDSQKIVPDIRMPVNPVEGQAIEVLTGPTKGVWEFREGKWQRGIVQQENREPNG